MLRTRERPPAQVQPKRSVEEEQRWQHEMQEMQEESDLRRVDDDVEAAATLFEWYAAEGENTPKSVWWYVVLASITTLLVVGMVVVGNFMAAIALGLGGVMLYVFSQRKPTTLRYRLMADGVAINNLLYHYRDLAAFNIIYQPGVTKTVIFRSKRTLAHHLHLELGEVDPLAVRDILIEFLPEDDTLEESLVDVVARRLGF